MKRIKNCSVLGNDNEILVSVDYNRVVLSVSGKELFSYTDADSIHRFMTIGTCCLFNDIVYIPIVYTYIGEERCSKLYILKVTIKGNFISITTTVCDGLISNVGMRPDVDELMVIVSNNNGSTTISWRDIDMPDDVYRLVVINDPSMIGTKDNECGRVVIGGDGGIYWGHNDGDTLCIVKAFSDGGVYRITNLFDIHAMLGFAIDDSDNISFSYIRKEIMKDGSMQVMNGVLNNSNVITERIGTHNGVENIDVVYEPFVTPLIVTDGRV